MAEREDPAANQAGTPKSKSGVDIKTLLARSKRAWARQDQWRPLLDEAYSYAMPYRNGYQPATGEGALKMEHVFDSTAMISVPRFAGRMQSDLMPPFERNAILEPGPAVPEEQRDDLAKQLETVTNLGHVVIAHSDFPTASHECYLDLASGRCNMKVLRGTRDNPVRCVAVPRSQVAIEEGPFGELEFYSQKRCISVDIIEGEYPGAVIPKSMLDEDAKDKGAKKFDVIEITYREKGVWYSDLIWERQGARLWSTKYRRTGPWVCARYFKVAGEHDGRGPLLIALPDIRVLNRTLEMLLAAAALGISGVYTVTDDGVMNLDTVSVAPGMFLQVESNGSGIRGPSIKALETGRDFNLAQIVLENLRANVKKILIDNQLPPDDASVRSPTEIAARMKELNQDTGAAFGRLQKEWVVSFWQRLLDILSDPAIGLITDVKIDQLFVRIQVTSPLARVQKMEDVKAFSDWVTLLQAVGGPQLVLLGAKIEDSPQFLAERLGVPSSQVRPKAESEALQKLVAQLVAAQVQAQAGAKAA